MGDDNHLDRPHVRKGSFALSRVTLCASKMLPEGDYGGRVLPRGKCEPEVFCFRAGGLGFSLRAISEELLF